MDQQLKNEFKIALESSNYLIVKKMIEQNADLVNVDLRPIENQEDHSIESPLILASKVRNFTLCELLLKSGADPNSSKLTEDPTEFGVPICNAIENQDYKLAKLLLDSGADPNAFPYCSMPMVENLYYQAKSEGINKEVLKYGFSQYINYNINIDSFRSSHDSIKTLIKVLKLGVIPNISVIVRDEYMELISDLLETCPTQNSPPLSYPKVNVFEGIVYCSSWYGYPEILKLSMEKCPNLFTNEVANWSIYRGIISHNRDGSIDEYLEIFETLLSFLKERNALNQLNNNSNFNPFYLIAEHFCWPNNYGFKANISTPDDIIKITQFFIDFGFSNYNAKHQENGMTPIQKAKERIEHTGIKEFISFISKLN